MCPAEEFNPNSSTFRGIRFIGSESLISPFSMSKKATIAMNASVSILATTTHGMMSVITRRYFSSCPAIDGEIFVSVARLAFRLFKLFRQSVSSLSVLKSMLALGENFLRISTSFHVVLTVSRGMRV